MRGFGLEGQPENDIVVDTKLAALSVKAFVSGGGYLWVADATDNRVYRVDPRTSLVKKVPLRQSADVLVFGDGDLWVLDSLAGKITRVDPSTGYSLPSVAISGDLHGIAVGGGNVWVTDASANQVQRIPEDLGSVSTPIPVGQIGGRPEAVAFDDGAIVVGFTDGTLAKIDPSNPSSPTVIWTHHVSVTVSSIAIDRGTVWGAGGPLEEG